MAEPYVCADPVVCKECGVIDRPLGFHKSGDFIHRCQHCEHEWIAITAEQAIEDAKARMEEAQEVINPVLRAFLRGRTRGTR